MLATPASLKKRLRGALQSYQFWLVAALLVLGAFLHYTSQIRATPVSLFGATSHLTRHAVERVLRCLVQMHILRHSRAIGARSGPSPRQHR